MLFLAILGHFGAFLTLKRGITGQLEFSRKKPMKHFNPYFEEHLCKISEKSKARLLRYLGTDGRTDERTDGRTRVNY